MPLFGTRAISVHPVAPRSHEACALHCHFYRVEILLDGLDHLALGDHVVLEAADFAMSQVVNANLLHSLTAGMQAASGSLLHALRIEDGTFLAIRGGRVQTFQANT